MTTTRVYYNTDASAPSLNGLAGSLINVLDACLVNGYGSKVASGWSKVFSGTNKAVYRAPQGNRHYLRVDDLALNARIRSFETMTDVDTGTGPMPTDTQLSGGTYLTKSGTADSVARPWVLVADQKRFWFINATSQTLLGSMTTDGNGFFYGDIISFKAGDLFHTMLIASDNSNSPRIGTISSSIATATTAHWLQRTHLQTGQSITAGKHTDAAKQQTAAFLGAGGSPYPDPVTGGLLLSPVFAHENAAAVVRGRIPGVWSPLHSTVGAVGDTFSGTGDLAGRQFLLINFGVGGATARGALEISDTWE